MMKECYTEDDRMVEIPEYIKNMSKEERKKLIAILEEAGRKEGAAHNMLGCIRNLMKNTGWPIEQAMTALKVPETDWPKYQELLGGQE